MTLAACTNCGGFSDNGLGYAAYSIVVRTGLMVGRQHELSATYLSLAGSYGNLAEVMAMPAF